MCLSAINVFIAAVLTTAITARRFDTPDISLLSAYALHNRRDYHSVVPPFSFIAILSLTPYSIIIIIIIFIITHQQKVTKFEEWICNVLFSLLSSVWRISKWSIIFFVTNVKTQTFYRIVQFFSAFFGAFGCFSFGGKHLSTCSIQNCACLCCVLTEFSDEDKYEYIWR